MTKTPDDLKIQYKQEVYNLIHQNYKKLPKNPDGSFNELAEGFHNNDIDALRHAYVSGRFTQEYEEVVAYILGFLNEYAPGGGSASPSAPKENNMDLWNNSVGRKYGKKHKSSNMLFFKLLEALKNGELIIDLDDPREYEENSIIKHDSNNNVIVVKESKTGENTLFFDTNKKNIMTKEEFIPLILAGQYPNYEIRTIKGKQTPVAKKDKFKSNNLC